MVSNTNIQTPDTKLSAQSLTLPSKLDPEVISSFEDQAKPKDQSEPETGYATA